VGLATRDDALGWRRPFDGLVARAAGVLRWPPEPERSGREPTLKPGDFGP